MGNYVDVSSNDVNDTIKNFKFDSVTGKLVAELSIEGKTMDLSDEVQAYLKGRLSYDPASLTILADTGIDGVRVNIGQEEMYLVCNNTQDPIPNGRAVYASGVDGTNYCLEVEPASSTSFITSAQVLGLATHTIPAGTIGLVTHRGVVRDFDTSGISAGLVWLGDNGLLTTDRPYFPLQRIGMGTVLRAHATEGQFLVSINSISRNDVSKSYAFTSQGIAAGNFNKAGFYDFNDTAFAFSESATSVTHGVAGRKRGAHAGIVPSGPGSVVGGGQVGLRVIGVGDFEDGTPQEAGHIDIITEDITILTADTYFETPDKFSDIITFELYVVSGAPTSYSLGANYGFAKYDDLQDRDYTLTGFECVWQGNANNNIIDIALLKHTASGWTFSPSGFVPGNGDICRLSVDSPIASTVGNDLDGAYKRVNLNALIFGDGDEGHIIEVTTSGNSSIQIMDLHIKAVSEELSF